jgi:orotate phosphoribosyltransferase
MAIGPADVEQLFRDSGALLDGHFVLSSGRHSPFYLEKFQVLQWPRRTQALCAEIVELVAHLPIETVAGPTTGGIILAHEVGRQLGTRAVYAERDDGGRGRVFRRGFQLSPAERVLVVDDIMSTGGSVEETIAAVRAAGAAVVGVAVLVDRSGGEARQRIADMPVVALWETTLPAYDAASCPQCAAGEPVSKPGTTPVKVVTR